MIIDCLHVQTKQKVQNRLTLKTIVIDLQVKPLNIIINSKVYLFTIKEKLELTIITMIIRDLSTIKLIALNTVFKVTLQLIG